MARLLDAHLSASQQVTLGEFDLTDRAVLQSERS